ncbi:uncharacterized protein LOC131939757 [Physella acuta]|uniref:uncharacterized protein LOC131939757 n=1 Tax=Physella acuta TaxID=109671 RepID=UPI0027DD191E|nr:uncharacterized protein LOC131939757 [Physella acuta]XP_059154226.1 uncharacterized protein LOC131939757 [Physella acuta]XP_059154227.1 uncharacterized protein LOC131939757 [Physella acuta]
MADRDSVEDIEEQIRRLQKKKEEVEYKKKLDHLRLLQEELSKSSSSSSGLKNQKESKTRDNRETEDILQSHDDILAQQKSTRASYSSLGASSSALDDLREEFQRSDDSYNAVNKLMTPEHKQAIRDNREILVANMSPGDLFNFLIAKKIFTESDVNRIKDKNGIELVNEELLNLLIKRSDRGFYVFVDALRQTLQDGLADIIDPPEKNSTRKRKSGEMRVNVDCERVVPINKRVKVCTCQQIEATILKIAEDAYSKIKRKDCTPSSFEQFKKELQQTNELVKETVEAYNAIKLVCSHGELTDISNGSISFTIRLSSLKACQRLWDICNSGVMLATFQSSFVTPTLLRKSGAKDIKLSLRVCQLEYLTCAIELANRELQVLKSAQSGPTPIKRRLRQKRTIDENSSLDSKQSLTHIKRQPFQEISINISNSSQVMKDKPNSLSQKSDLKESMANCHNDFGKQPSNSANLLANITDIQKNRTSSPKEIGLRSRIVRPAHTNFAKLKQKRDRHIVAASSSENFTSVNNRHLKHEGLDISPWKNMCPYNLRYKIISLETGIS